MSIDNFETGSEPHREAKNAEFRGAKAASAAAQRSRTVETIRRHKKLGQPQFPRYLNGGQAIRRAQSQGVAAGTCFQRAQFLSAGRPSLATWRMSCWYRCAPTCLSAWLKNARCFVFSSRCFCLRSDMRYAISRPSTMKNCAQAARSALARLKKCAWMHAAMSTLPQART